MVVGDPSEVADEARGGTGLDFGLSWRRGEDGQMDSPQCVL